MTWDELAKTRNLHDVKTKLKNRKSEWGWYDTKRYDSLRYKRV